MSDIANKKIILPTKGRDLKAWCQDNNQESILLEWDYEKNNPITPEMVFAYSKKPEYFWKCKSGLHSYLAPVAAKTKEKPCGCNYCNRKRILKGYNDLETWARDNKMNYLIAEWDCEKNNLEPSDYFPTSHKQVWWVCPKCKKSYKAQISNRTSKGSGCSYCNGHDTVNEHNNLEAWCRNNGEIDILKEYIPELNNNLLPSEVRYASNKEMVWKCLHCGDEYTRKIHHRTLRHFGCNKCRVSGTSFPEQFLFLTLSQIINGVFSRDRRYGFELDIFIEPLNLGIEYNGYYYHETSAQKRKDKEKIESCKNNNVRLLAINNIQMDEKIYESEIVWKYSRDKYDLIVLLENIVKWINREYSAQYSAKKLNINQLYIEARKSTYGIDVEKSLGKQYPDIAKEWDYDVNGDITPYMVMPGNHDLYGWVCSKCGFKWYRSVQGRTQGAGCRKCASKAKGKKWSEKHVKQYSFYSWCMDNKKEYLLDSWDYEGNNGKGPKDYAYGNSDDKIAWVHCKTKHKWYTTLPHRRLQGPDCYCLECIENRRKNSVRISMNKGKQTLKDWCIEQGREDILSEWDPCNNLTPEDYTPGSHTKVFWKCNNCGAQYQSVIRVRINSNKTTGCCYHRNIIKG